MAENQNENQNQNQNDENDPYKFFKFPGPENNDDKDKNKRKKDNGKKRFPIFTILLLTFVVVAVAEFFFVPRNDDLIDYSDFKAKIESGEIKSVVISDSYFIGYGTVIETKQEGKGIKLFTVPSIKAAQQYKTSAVLTQSFLDFLEENNVHYKFAAKQNNWFLQLLLNLIVPFGLILLMYFFLFRKMGGGSNGGIGSIFSVGSSRAKVVEEGKIKTRFTDVAGVDEAKEELVEVVDFLKSPEKYTDIGVRFLREFYLSETLEQVRLFLPEL